MQDLDSYNQQVLACQDEAFTLAAYLLGDDVAADDVLARAFLHVYQDPRRASQASIRLPVLREVIRLCSRTRLSSAGGLLSKLTRRERQALLVVDLLGLTYDQATNVLACSRDHLVRHLAKAREKVAGSRLHRSPSEPGSLSLVKPQHL
jgi:DNA-directed RNA polymerase specialized sigma24 family protein